MISTLDVTHIDFDIEGAAIAYTADNDLRFKAINALEAANPGLVVSVTIPVLPAGPTTTARPSWPRPSRTAPASTSST